MLKENEKRSYRQKIFSKHIADKGLLSTAYKNSNNSIIKRQNPQIFKWEKDLNRHIVKVDIQMANNHRKKCSPSLVLREMSIKTHNTITLLYLIKGLEKNFKP